MKRFLATILITILLTSAICSCRSSSQSSLQYADTTAVVATQSESALTTEEIISIITSSCELDIGGIKVEFYPPDSVHPPARAAPKTLSIEKVTGRTSQQNNTRTEAASQSASDASITAQQSESLQSDVRTDNESCRMPSVIKDILIIAAFAAFIFLLWRRIRN